MSVDWAHEAGNPSVPLSRAAGLAAFRARLEAEQDRWFLWLPVAFALGIALYIKLPFEPDLTQILAPVVVAAILRWISRHRFLPLLAANVVLVAAMGFAAARLRSEIV